MLCSFLLMLPCDPHLGRCAGPVPRFITCARKTSLVFNGGGVGAVSPPLNSTCRNAPLAVSWCVCRRRVGNLSLNLLMCCRPCCSQFWIPRLRCLGARRCVPRKFPPELVEI
eukprot:4596329-Amphidinium_carterae.1